MNQGAKGEQKRTSDMHFKWYLLHFRSSMYSGWAFLNEAPCTGLGIPELQKYHILVGLTRTWEALCTRLIWTWEVACTGWAYLNLSRTLYWLGLTWTWEAPSTSYAYLNLRSTIYWLGLPSWMILRYSKSAWQGAVNWREREKNITRWNAP